MVPAAHAPNQPSGIDALPENLLRAPIDYLNADHFRHQAVYDLLEELILDPEAPTAASRATAVLAFLERERPHHIADEEQDLFPLLSARCAPADRIGPIRRLLGDEHRRADTLSEVVIEGLRSLAAGHPPSQPCHLQCAAAAMAESQRRHLAWENELVLPLARERLTKDDLEAMGRHMAARRGVDYPD